MDLTIVEVKGWVVRPYRMSRAWVVRKKVRGKWTIYGCRGRLYERI
jgi:hypothetical protein